MLGSTPARRQAQRDRVGRRIALTGSADATVVRQKGLASAFETLRALARDVNLTFGSQKPCESLDVSEVDLLPKDEIRSFPRYGVQEARALVSGKLLPSLYACSWHSGIIKWTPKLARGPPGKA